MPEALAEIVLPEHDDLSEELVDSALKELTNILVQSFLQAVMQLIDKPLFASVPVMTVDMFKSSLCLVFISIKVSSAMTFLLLKTTFTVQVIS